MKQTQISTMHEVAKGLQHHINNPLAVITLSISQLRRLPSVHPDYARQLDSLEESTQKIAKAVGEFSKAEVYRVESVGGPIGNVASPSSLQ